MSPNYTYQTIRIRLNQIEKLKCPRAYTSLSTKIIFANILYPNEEISDDYHTAQHPLDRCWSGFCKGDFDLVGTPLPSTFNVSLRMNPIRLKRDEYESF